MAEDKHHLHGGPQVSFQPTFEQNQPPPRIDTSLLPGQHPQEAPCHTMTNMAPVWIINSKVSPLQWYPLKWQGIASNTSLPDSITNWCTSAPASTVCHTPKCSGKWLCYKFCTEGLMCQLGPSLVCGFTHVDLAQPNTWNSTTLQPIINFLATGGCSIGLNIHNSWHQGHCLDIFLAV